MNRLFTGVPEHSRAKLRLSLYVRRCANSSARDVRTWSSSKVCEPHIWCQKWDTCVAIDSKDPWRMNTRSGLHYRERDMLKT